MKRRLYLYPIVIFLLACCTSVKAQPYLGIQVLFGTELYTHYRPPSIYPAEKNAVIWTPVVNPMAGISGIWAFSDNEETMPYLKLNSCVTYSPFNIPTKKDAAQGAINFSFGIGPGVYLGGGLVHLQLLYGYQLNKIDLYGRNPTITSSDRWFGLHTLELSGGLGFADWVSIAPYVRIGFDRNNAFSAHIGIRAGIGFWNDEAAF
jgi:hypothetical protein